MVQPYWRRLIAVSPEILFLIFATVGGLALAALIPPMAGGNELFNFQRVAGIAAFHPLIEPAQIPSGTMRFLETTHAQFNPTRLPPYHYSSTQFDAVASIPLDAAAADDAPCLLGVFGPPVRMPAIDYLLVLTAFVAALAAPRHKDRAASR